MRNETRLLYNQYAQTIAALNSVESIANKFTVSPSVQQKLEDRIQENSGFLGKINVVPVTEKQGEKLGLGVAAPIASRTNTSQNPRQPRSVHQIDLIDEYNCQKTDYDTFITYAQLDMWAKFPDFQLRIRNHILKRQALDRIMIGFNGTSIAANTNPNLNPLLQDVNKGWLQKYRENASQRVLDHGANTGQIRVGSAAGADYANLDAVVFDMVNSLIEPWYQEDTALVAIVGRSLLADKYFPIINQDHAPSEKLAADIVISQKRIGGLPAVRVPFVPDGTILVTPLDNLSIYWQEGSRRRLTKEEPELDRITNYESSNDDYIVEDYGRGCFAENIVLEW